MAWDDSATGRAVCWAHLAILLTAPHPNTPSCGSLCRSPRCWTSPLGGHTHTTALHGAPAGLSSPMQGRPGAL